MEKGHFTKAGLASAVLVILFLAFLEYYWRSKGMTVSYNDDKVMWADQRRKIDQSEKQGTVFSGGSRIKFDLDIATWKELTGEDPVQLAIVGTPARLIILDLADDENFRGNLIIDVAEQQFFSLGNPLREKMAKETLHYFHDQTPAQLASARINFALESRLVFLEESRFGLNGLLDDIKLKNRKGMVVMPIFAFERGMVSTNAGRQNLIMPMYLNDTTEQRLQTDYWMRGAVTNMARNRPPKGDTLLRIFKEYSVAIDKIRARGGKVVFVRPPSTGGYLEQERKTFPRTTYWDQLLIQTKTPGIHFADYPVMAALPCAELSHLSPDNAIIFTRELVRILKEEQGWKFENNLKPAL